MFLVVSKKHANKGFLASWKADTRIRISYDLFQLLTKKAHIPSPVFGSERPIFCIWGIVMKRSILLFSVLFLLTPSLWAQSIGQVPCYARIFSTGLPHYEGNLPEDPPMMSKEKRETALECIEWTFGKVKEYTECYGECCGMHHLDAVLENGDTLFFEEGRLVGYDLASPRFVVAKESVKGGLQVGRKPGTPLTDKVHIEPREKDPSTIDFYDSYGDIVSCFEVDSEGIIVRILVYPIEC